MDIQDLFAKLHKDEKKTVHDCYVIPQQHIRELYRIIDENESGDSSDMWRFLGELFPLTSNHRCNLNTENILQPHLEVLSDSPIYPPKNVLYEVPPEHRLRAAELCHIYRKLPRGQDKLAMYEFYSYLHELFPDVEDFDKVRVCQHPSNRTIWICAKADED